MEYHYTYKGHRIQIMVPEVRGDEFSGEWLSSFTITKPDGKPLGASGPGSGTSEVAARQHALQRAKDRIDKTFAG